MRKAQQRLFNIRTVRSAYCLLFSYNQIELQEEVKIMAVKIRLKRLGKKKSPFYRIVVADERSPRDGKNIAEIGTYDPNQEPCVVKIDEDEAKKWLANGAQPTDVVARLFKQAGIAK